jgi:hypothetical protein
MIFSFTQVLSLKKHLEELRRKGLVKEWGISYENGINRFVAANFFFRAENKSRIAEICRELQCHEIAEYKDGPGKNKAELLFRIEFNSRVLF